MTMNDISDYLAKAAANILAREAPTHRCFSSPPRALGVRCTLAEYEPRMVWSGKPGGKVEETSGQNLDGVFKRLDGTINAQGHWCFEGNDAAMSIFAFASPVVV